MKKTKLTALLAGMLAMGILVGGCGGDADKGGKVLKVGGTVSVISQLDPAKDWDGWYIVRYGVGETLFKIDKEGKAQPWLAEKLENIDPMTWKLTIKDNVTFSNGEKMTAEKVIASLKRTAEMNKRAIYLQGATFTAEGNVITIKTDKPAAGLMDNLCDPYSTIIDVAGTKDFANNPIGTGPFMMKSLDPNKKAVMVKNPKYWGGEVKTDQVEYTVVADQNTLTMALKSGEIDIAQDLNATSAAAIANESKIKIEKVTQPRVTQVYFNLEKMQDKAVREAIMYGVNKESIGTNTLKGGTVAAYAGTPDGTAYAASNLKPHMFNAEIAKKILADAGYKDTNGDGIVEKDGKPLHIKLSYYKRASLETISTEMQAQLKAIGIDVEIVPHEKANYYAPGDYEMGLYYVVTAPTGELTPFLRDNLRVGGKSNFGRYNNPVVEGIFDELAGTFDMAKRIELTNQVQQIVIDDAAMDYIGFNILHVGMNKDVTGYELSANDYYQLTKDTDKK